MYSSSYFIQKLLLQFHKHNFLLHQPFVYQSIDCNGIREICTLMQMQMHPWYRRIIIYHLPVYLRSTANNVHVECVFVSSATRLKLCTTEEFIIPENNGSMHRRRPETYPNASSGAHNSIQQIVRANSLWVFSNRICRADSI